MGFFGGMPVQVQFILAFIIVLGLIGAAAWAVRRFGAGRLGGGGLRGRQPRLAVIDYASVDGRRRLILIRRDNVEHLVMIGGPTDVVVESNIVRAAPAARDVAVPRPPAAEPMPRAIAAPDNAANGSWPLQPEPQAASAPARMPRSEQRNEEAWPLQPHAETPPRPPLAALADELSPRPAPPPPPPPRNRPQSNARPQVVEPRQERQEPRPESRQETKPEPRIPAAQPAPAESATSIDQSLADMAHKLEAALRKPKAERAAGAAAPSAEAPAAAAPAPPPAAAPARNRPVETKLARPDAKQQQPNPGKALYDSLEQEMASLLGRPTAKN